TGGTTLSQGTLILGHPGALGTGSLWITPGASLGTAAGLPFPAVKAIWSGNFTFLGLSALDLSTGSAALTADTTLTVAAGSLTVGGVSGTAALNKDGAGTLILSGTNTYSGATTVLAGTLIIDGPNSLPASSTLTAGSGATVLLRNGAQPQSFTGSGNLVYAPGNNATIGLGDFSGNSSLVLSGSSSLTKVGSGSIALTEASTFSGKTWIQSGTLWVASLNKVSGGMASSSLGAPTTASNGTIDLGSLSSTGTLITGGSLYESYLTGTPYTLSANASNPWVLAKDLGQKWTFEADYLMNSTGGLTTLFTYGWYNDGIMIRAKNADAIYVKNTSAGAFDLFG
ncbi:MAG: hypothetical protein EBR81_17995, partial [Proteobacteria bacterium]|nr:hypothetical protein [Pseudomonadota bacterium]